MKKISKKLFTFALPLMASLQLTAQTLEHPVIWTTAQERGLTLEKIENYDWAQSIVKQLHDRVDGAVAKHASNPSAILEQIPHFATHDKENVESKAGPLASAHNAVIARASDAAILYHITNEAKYAQFAADILGVYFDEIAARTPATTTICGYEFFDPRTTYSVLAVTYDFIYNYLQQPEAKIYDFAAKEYVEYDHAKAQTAFTNIVGNVLQEYGRPDVHGQVVSNHPILTAPGALFAILCIDDDKERERLLDVFWEKGTAHQNSFKHTILPLFSDQGIWPESLSYSFMPIITMVFNLMDRIKPEMNVIESADDIINGNFFFDYLRHPNRTFVRYGDSKRYNDQTEDLYIYTLDFAKRNGYTTMQQKAELALSQRYETIGGYKPKLSTNIHNNFEPLELFWGHQIPDEVGASVNFNVPTVIVEHAGVALQRNAVEENNPQYGLCGIIGGAHYVHSHLTGISMELYGANYIMAANAGLPPTVSERQIPLHEHYFRLYAGSNTVIVNGTSHGLNEGSWKGKANVWQNTTVNIAAEPQHLEEPISANFSFATQLLEDKVNNCDQQRTLAIVRTSPTSAYYFDMFRSESLDENKFHDYIYHNIGDKTILSDAKDKVMPLTPTDRYQNDIGDQVFSPGWRYFEDTNVSKPTSDAVKVRFDVEEGGSYMYMFIPAGVEREYTLALTPPTREARDSYLAKKTQLVAIRQQGEAWDRPYVSIFEPSNSKESTIQSVEPLMDGQKTVGAIVVSQVGETKITDYIICQEDDNATYINKKLKLQFKGRYAVVRTEKSKSGSNLSLYIGEGKTISFRGNSVDADKSQRGFKSIEL